MWLKCKIKQTPLKGSVTPYQIWLTSVRQKTKFSICLSLSACVSCLYLIRRMHSLSGEVHSIQRKGLCMCIFERTPLEKGAPWMCGSYALACLLFGICAFLFLYLSSLHPLMSSGHDLQPDYYLTCSGSTGGVPDDDHMFSGQVLTRNAWKLANNGCETVVQGTKLMTYIFWEIIKSGFPVSLSPVQKHSLKVRRMFCQLLMCCTFVLPCPLLLRWCPFINH